MAASIPLGDDTLVKLAETSEATRWQKIAQVLRDEIAGGVLPAGARLPNELQLAERFGVHRHTLRQAMQQLAREGFVQVRQGAGTFVRELVLDYALHRRTRLSENLADNGERGSRELRGHGEQPAGEWAPLLELERRAPVAWLATRVVVRGRPLALSWAAFPLPRLAGIGDAFDEHRSIGAAVAALGVQGYARRSSEVSARLPQPEEADALARPAAEPVLVVRFVNVDGDGRPVEAGRTVFAADALKLHVDHRA